MTSTTARILASRPWLAPSLGLLVLAAGVSAWWLPGPRAAEGPLVTNPKVMPGRTQTPGLETLRREPQLSALKLFWTSTLPRIRSGFVDKRVREFLLEYRRNKLDRAQMKALLASKLDPLRAPISQVRAISRELFASPEVPAPTKLEVYSALQMVAHLERLAAVKKLPLLELLHAFDWSLYGQVGVSFDNPALPLPVPKVNRLVSHWVLPPYFTDPKLLPGIVVDQQLVSEAGPQPLIEWRPSQTEQDALLVFARGERDGVPEMTFQFSLDHPARIGAGELWLAYSDCSPLQYFELEVNGAPLVLRPPLAMEPHTYYRGAVNVDPALLKAGPNVVKLRLKPIPEMTEGRRTFVWYMELRTRLKGNR